MTTTQDTWKNPNAVPTMDMTIRHIDAETGNVIETLTVERCRFLSVDAIRAHYADYPDAAEIPDGVKFVRRIGRPDDGSVIIERTLRPTVFAVRYSVRYNDIPVADCDSQELADAAVERMVAAGGKRSGYAVVKVELRAEVTS